jgi:DNA-binding transcriptional ArsR family regulator
MESTIEDLVMQAAAVSSDRRTVDEVDTDDLLPMEVLERAAAGLRVLAHPHRLRMCDILARERVSVNALARHLDIPSNAVSQHLNMMKAHGIVASEREGKTVYYRVADSRAIWLLGCIRQHCSGK